MASGIVTTEKAFGKEATVLGRTITEIGVKEAPFLSLITASAPESRKGKAAAGHTWFYDVAPEGDEDNAHLEGGVPAESEYFVGSQLLNHFQIVKNAYGVSESEDAGENIEGKKSLAKQLDKTQTKHIRTLEKILLSDTAPVQRTKTVAGRSGGLFHFATVNNTLTISNLALDWNLFREALKMGFLNGVTMSNIMMGDFQKDRLDDIIFSKSQSKMSDNKIENNVTTIGQTPYGNNLKIHLSPDLAADEILFCRPNLIHKVDWRAMKNHNLLTSNDAIEKELRSEFTLRVDNPFAFIRLKGLKIS
ncbi:DUF5309 family protein [Sulfurimonas sp.]|uniref:SU10 major capsid protein n=1 Tax=Sulfurimonas sp. TaxID=2022749 RepID=UPI0025F847DB|nr:DUF5309 family protein [Sulfurimonas sp.]